MQWFILGIALFVAAGFGIRWLSEAEAKDVKKILSFLIFVGLVLLAGWLLLTGKLAAMVAALVAALPFFARLLKLGLLWPLLRRILFSTRRSGAFGGGHGNSGSSGTSEIRTLYLHMQLDLETGQLGGTVMHGPFKGRDLDGLGLDDLRLLYVDCCSAPDQSRTVLETYFERRPDCAGWQNWDTKTSNAGTAGAGNGDGHEQHGHTAKEDASSDEINVAQARQILGVSAQATRREINQAYKKRIKDVHPDHGGSDRLASRINAARALLLRLCKD